MKNEVTTTARRIARAHNKRISGGFAGNGKLLFDREGNGGEWYSDGAYGFGPELIAFWMRRGRVTASQVQEVLDHE